VSECDREASQIRRPWPSRGCCVMKIRIYYSVVLKSLYIGDTQHRDAAVKCFDSGVARKLLCLRN